MCFGQKTTRSLYFESAFVHILYLNFPIAQCRATLSIVMQLFELRPDALCNRTHYYCSARSYAHIHNIQKRVHFTSFWKANSLTHYMTTFSNVKHDLLSLSISHSTESEWISPQYIHWTKNVFQLPFFIVFKRKIVWQKITMVENLHIFVFGLNVSWIAVFGLCLVFRSNSSSISSRHNMQYARARMHFQIHNNNCH